MTPERVGNENREAQRQRFLEELVYPNTQNPRIRAAFGLVDRASFIPFEFKDKSYLAYTDKIISLKTGSSMSQPTLTATMLDMLLTSNEGNILEIGGGTGYTAAILAHCTTGKVFTVEYDRQLAEDTRRRLERLGYGNRAFVHTGDGALGYPRGLRYKHIIATCGMRTIPRMLIDQLEEGGRILAPVGKDLDMQRLILGVKKGDRLRISKHDFVSFWPLISSHEGGWTQEMVRKQI